jgi:hypothetical protein
LSKKSVPLPAPTSWVRRLPEGEPPVDVLLVCKCFPVEVAEDEVPVYMFCLGFYSDKLKVFLDLDERALEEAYELTAYAILQDEDGNTIPIIA